MSSIISVDVELNENLIMGQIEDLINDDQTMLQIHNQFAKFCAPYVPKQEGVLSDGAKATAGGVEYDTPYAHYMYEGELYLTEDGRAFALKNEKKYPTGIPLKYSKEKNANATDHWDKAMIRDRGDDFIRQCEIILNRRAREISND